jgi:peptidoglycan-associated lipoprotein
MLHVTRWCPFLVLAMVGGACHTRPPAVAPSRSVSNAATVPARPPAPPPPPRAAARPSAASVPSEAELFRRKSLSELNAEHPLSDVFFDYDQNVLREDARRLLQRDAEWLAKWPQTRIRIDGQCDERGTAEYNLALGDRRASTVREYLADLGVKPDRIQTRTLGKEAPYCHDETESCWSQNRRGHFEITDK